MIKQKNSSGLVSINHLTKSHGFTAIRTIFKIRIQRLSTIATMLLLTCRSMPLFRTKYRPGVFAAITDDHGLTLFNPEYGDEKQAQVMVYSFGICLV